MIIWGIKNIDTGKLVTSPVAGGFYLWDDRREALEYLKTLKYRAALVSGDFLTKAERHQRMSTNDVPGARAANMDELAMGCWAEHADGSLIFVESTEGKRVVYLMFDVARDPIIEYRDAMPEASFKSTFTWEPESKKAASKKTNEKWTWHDKTPFPWDRVIKHGFSDGVRHASADGLRTAAERVADSLRLRARDVRPGDYDHRSERVERANDPAMMIWDKLNRALREFMR